MTLDEYIEVLKKHQKCDVNKCIKFNCSDCEFAISMDKVPTDKEILGYFEELKVYKKAFELACNELAKSEDLCNGTELKRACFDGVCQECWKEYFLQKVRE